jgi:N-acetylglucosamine kinase-like BadF-type ATPase
MAAPRRFNFAVGFDGGGTKTDCVVIDADGTVQGQGSAGPSNPLLVGFDAAFRQLTEAAVQALDGARLKPLQIDAVCAGLAGAGARRVVRRAIVFLSREFPHALTHVTSDLEIALETAVDGDPGVVLVSGTGSSAFGRNAAGTVARAGGFGHFIGDEGSGYEIGRRAVAYAARARDQATPITVLSDNIRFAFGSPPWEDLIERIAKDPEDVFPRLVPLVFAAAEMGDSAACEILTSSALSLADMAVTVVRRLEMEQTSFALVKCGGVLSTDSLMDSVLEQVLLSAAPHAKISRLDLSPAIGAARIAARLAREELQAPAHASME